MWKGGVATLKQTIRLLLFEWERPSIRIGKRIIKWKQLKITMEMRICMEWNNACRMRRQESLKEKPSGKSWLSRMKNYTFYLFFFLLTLLFVYSLFDPSDRERDRRKQNDRSDTQTAPTSANTREILLTTAMYNTWHGIRASRNAIGARFAVMNHSCEHKFVCLVRAHWFTLHEMPARELVPEARTLCHPGERNWDAKSHAI